MRWRGRAATIPGPHGTLGRGAVRGRGGPDHRDRGNRARRARRLRRRILIHPIPESLALRSRCSGRSWPTPSSRTASAPRRSPRTCCRSSSSPASSNGPLRLEASRRPVGPRKKASVQLESTLHKILGEIGKAGRRQKNLDQASTPNFPRGLSASHGRERQPFGDRPDVIRQPGRHRRASLLPDAPGRP